MRRWLFFPLVCSCVAAIAAITPACNARIVDVGTNDAGTAMLGVAIEDGGGKGSAYGCSEWIDDELYAIREGGCPGFCPSPGERIPAISNPYDLVSKKDLMAATAGEWLFCEGSFGPEGAVGVEFAPGCRLFFLRFDGEGKVVRGVEKTFQASYDIHSPRPLNAPARIDVHLDDERTVQFEVAVDRCPEQLRLSHTYAASVSLARPVGNPNNPGNPTR